jgi:5'-3' exonuclease
MAAERTILVDGDTIAFRAASAVQHKVISDLGTAEFFARLPEGEAAVDNMMQALHDQLQATHIKVFLSCPGEENWRLKVADTYKSNRKGSVRPLILDELKDYLRRVYGATHLAFLEADDCLGIYATDPDLIQGEKIVVGKDKDFKTIPGLHYQLDDKDEKGQPIIREVTEMEAAKNHYAQTLVGDAVDGFEGCPGVGPARAKRIVDTPERLVPKEGVITRGKNKGQKVVKWHSAGPSSIWEAVVSNYEKAGLGEGEALIAGRLSKILLSGDYDMENHVVRLWVPGTE